MKLAVIGAGKIGGTLGKALAAAGHDVHYGTRKPEGSIRAALDGAEAVIIAIPGQAVADFARDHADELSRKLISDAANNLGGDGPANSSADFAALVPTARYARAFSTLGWENFADPIFDGVVADLFYSTDQAESETVGALISDVGLNPVYLGPDQYDLLDQVLKLWFDLAISQGRGRHLAFKVL
jgi:8-hydroxy-5-deazaflavin:NADPH oxidoreductase